MSGAFCSREPAKVARKSHSRTQPQVRCRPNDTRLGPRAPLMTSPTIADMSFSGEISATYRPVATEPELSGPKVNTKFLATGTMTDGGFGLFQWDMQPEAGGPGAHYHKTFSE